MQCTLQLSHFSWKALVLLYLSVLVLPKLYIEIVMIRYATTVILIVILFSVHIFAYTSIYAGTVNTSWYKAMGAINLICAVGSLHHVHVSHETMTVSR